MEFILATRKGSNTYLVMEELKQEIYTQEIHLDFVSFTSEDDWKTIRDKRFKEFSGNNKNHQVRINACIFDDFHKLDPQWHQEFQYFLRFLLSSHNNMKFILIMTHWKPFPLNDISWREYKLLPLTPSDTRLLFYQISGAVVSKEVDICIDFITGYSHFRPGFITALANLISNHLSKYSLEDISTYLCCRDGFAVCNDEGILNQFSSAIDHIEKHLIPRKIHRNNRGQEQEQEKGQKNIFSLQGNFQTDNLKEISKLYFQRLLLNKQAGYKISQFTRNRLEPVIRRYVPNSFNRIYCSDVIQLKYSKILGKALQTAEDIYNKGLLFQSVGIINDNWEKISRYMRQGIHLTTNGESYKIYFQIAILAECIISLCYPRISKDFFRGCLNYAYFFGNREEQALMMAIYGRALTAYPELGGYKEAMQYYIRALPILKARRLQYRTLLLYTSMGFNCYMQGKYGQAIRYSREGLDIDVQDQNRRDVHHATANCALVLAYNLSYQGNYNLVEELLMSTLDVVGDTGHPSVSIMLNTLGLNAERNGNQTAKALKYYLASLVERRKTACINTEKLVVPLCNVGKLLSGIQGKHTAALRLLKEAQTIRRFYGRLHQTTSLVLKYISEVYKRQHLIAESIPPLLEALDIYQHINADFHLIISLYSDIAHSYLLVNKQRHAIIYFQKIITAKNQILSIKPDNTHIASSLEHIVRLSTETQEVQKYYVEDLLAELKRLSQIRDLRRTQKTKYLTQIGNYSYSLLLMENRISMQENQIGLSIESIPGICSHCQQYMTIGQCSKTAYLKLVCSLSNGVN